MDTGQLAALMLIGLLLAGLALTPAYLAHRRAGKLRATGRQVRAVVVSVDFFLGRPSGWRSIVRFTTQEGQLVQAACKKDYARRAAGQVVWVTYDERNPYDFVI